MKWFRRQPKQPKQYVFRNIGGHDISMQEGDWLTVDPWFTVQCTEGGVFDFYPILSDEEMSARSERQIRAKYGLVPAVGG